MTTRTPREVVTALLDGVAAGRWDDLAELYATDTVVRHPFARDASALLTGREALRAHFGRLASSGMSLAAREPVTVYETTDPEIVVARFTYAGTDATDTPIEMAACFIWRIRDGLIVDAHDYLDTPRPTDPKDFA
ncbi:nuclear transport factor 2 family protein [Pseudonocardia xishanensis]|uniref:Nuclear transport factor 2 family protein n=1 Tax=Pseudonocardia xishanensis TaxID=630995 RepID=A0ABP8S0Z8_9PSEU